MKYDPNLDSVGDIGRKWGGCYIIYKGGVAILNELTDEHPETITFRGSVSLPLKSGKLPKWKRGSISLSKSDWPTHQPEGGYIKSVNTLYLTSRTPRRQWKMGFHFPDWSVTEVGEQTRSSFLFSRVSVESPRFIYDMMCPKYPTPSETPVRIQEICEGARPSEALSPHLAVFLDWDMRRPVLALHGMTIGVYDGSNLLLHNECDYLVPYLESKGVEVHEIN